MARGYHWEVARGSAAIDRLASAWGWASATECPGADRRVRCGRECFWRAFGGHDDALHIHALRRGDELACALPLRRTGRLLRTWSSIVNGHTPFVQYATSGDAALTAQQMLDHLLESAGAIEFERFSGRRTAVPGAGFGSHAPRVTASAGGAAGGMRSSGFSGRGRRSDNRCPQSLSTIRCASGAG